MENNTSNNIEKLRDPKFYVENFCKIKGKKQGNLIPLILNEAQKDLFNTIKKNSRVIILKARQIGFSTAVVSWIYHNTIMNPGTTSAIIGYNAQLAGELLDKVKTFYRNTPEELKPTVHYDSKWEISFPRIDSKILVLSSGDNVGHGFTLHNVLVTELSLWEKQEEKIIGLDAAVPPEGKLIIESCVAGDTIIFTENGPRFVSDIHDWDNNEYGFSNGKEIKLDGHYGLKSTDTYYNSGVQDGFKIRTRKGYELKMSSIHKIFVCKDDKLEFVEAKDLKVGDFVPIKFGQNLWGNNDKVNFVPKEYGFNKKNLKLFNVDYISEDLSYLMGLIIGDGYINERYVVITNTDEDVTNFLLNNKLGLHFLQGKKENSYHYRCTNKSFVDFLINYIGFKYEKARKKEIPSIIFEWSEKNIKAFLQGLFDTDASCRKNRGTVALTSTSKKIIDITRMLLLNFGIITSTHSYISKPSKRVKVFSSGYVLEMNNWNSKLFLEKIGFRIKRKQAGYRNIEKNNSYIVPGIGEIIKNNLKELGIKRVDISNGLNSGLYSKSNNINYKTLEKILNKCENKNSTLFKNIKKIYDYKYYYDNIVEIIPIKENVYDFTVDDGHTVVYNGIVGHQTPRGTANHYAKLWFDKENSFVKKKYGWNWGYSKVEIEAIKKRTNNPMQFAQEYDLAFLSSGLAVFDNKKIQKCRDDVLKVGDEVEDGDQKYKVEEVNDWKIYKKPHPEHFYVCGVDPADGVEGGDYSAAIILDRTTGEEVAFFRRYIPQDEFAKKLNETGRIYNNAHMVVEMNSGMPTMMHLKNFLYPSLYFRQSKLETLGREMSDRLGWRTTRINRGELINEFDKNFREGTLLLHSEELLNEMLTFIYDKNGDMNASQGYHDDTIFAISLALQGFKVMYNKVLEQLDYSQFLPKSFSY